MVTLISFVFILWVISGPLSFSINGIHIVIPGYIAQISGELEEELPGWKITVGPREAVDIKGYLKAQPK